ncbi:guanylyl cyclase [Holotrichia oblita]|uniref:Guanylyl cyclase n=1 Tax=Holotrichia oblita TaxID=644536 RepID=A0ACB9THP9_HOLOL|nr:guanylyl cyclase [Holotrichia oblita]
MDEKGCRLMLHHQQRVLAEKGSKRVHSIGSEHAENVTIVGCANALGQVIPPMILFKGQRLKPVYYDGLPTGAIVHMTSKGSAAWRIHLSETTKERLEKAGGYQLEYRGPIDVKGKGTMHTYWLLGKSGFDKPLPVPPPIDLDESLIICKPDFEQIEETSSYTASPPHELFSARQSHDHYMMTESVPPRSPNPDPTFMKTMECSKFSTLRNQDTNDNHHHAMVKSTSSDTPMSLGTPVSASEVAAALLGASTSSLCGFRRHKRIEEEDLSTPYNHYKCLSPKERVGKLLRRQFSLDRTEEILNENSQNIELPPLPPPPPRVRSLGIHSTPPLVSLEYLLD